MALEKQKIDNQATIWQKLTKFSHVKCHWATKSKLLLFPCKTQFLNLDSEKKNISSDNNPFLRIDSNNFSHYITYFLLLMRKIQ